MPLAAFITIAADGATDIWPEITYDRISVYLIFLYLMVIGLTLAVGEIMRRYRRLLWRFDNLTLLARRLVPAANQVPGAEPGYADFHRMASEELLAATQANTVEQSRKHLAEAVRQGREAYRAATTERERDLSQAFLRAVADQHTSKH